jgi:hypothetical protein
VLPFFLYKMKYSIALSSVAAVAGLNKHSSLSFLEKQKLSLDKSSAFVTDKVYMNDKLLFCHDPDILGVKGSEPQDVCHERELGDALNTVKVCGVAMQVIVYSQHGCMANANEIAKVGICDTAVKPETCIEVASPEPGTPGSEENVWLKNALSYKIQVCPGMEVPPPPVLVEGRGDAEEGATDGAEEMKEKAEAEVAADEAEAAEDAGAGAGRGEEPAASPSEEQVEEVPSRGALDGTVIAPTPAPAEDPVDARAQEAEARAAAVEAEDVPAESPAEEETTTTPEPIVVDSEPFELPQPAGTGGAVTKFQFHVPIVHHVVNVVKHVQNWFGGWR